MRGFTVLVLTVSLLTVGCLGDNGGQGSEDDGAPGEAGLSFLPGVNVSTRWPGSEPVVDVAPDGTLYLEGIGTAEEAGTTHNANRVWRSLDDGATWTDVTPPAIGNTSSNDGYVAVGPDGSVYAANVFGLTFQLLKSTDQGETWVPLEPPRIPALMHRHWVEPVADGVVHVTIEALDPAAAPVLLGGPTELEGAVDHANKGMYYMRSEDGGETWTVPERIDPNIVYVGQSNMAVGPGGEDLYVVRYEEDQGPPLAYTYEEGTFYLLASQDGGDTWERREMFPLNASIGSALTSLTVDADGVLYYAWAQEQAGRSVTHLAVSHDGGSTWSVRSLALSSGTQAMPFTAARGSGTLGVLWYDAHERGMPGEVDATWHVHYALLEGAADGDPEVQTVPVSGTVHEGSICVKGPACGEDGDRRLLDYLWVAFGPDERAHLAFASTQWDRPSAFPVYVGQPS